MSYAHDCVEGLRQACRDVRQPITGVLALAEAALAEADLPENARLSQSGRRSRRMAVGRDRAFLIPGLGKRGAGKYFLRTMDQ